MAYTAAELHVKNTHYYYVIVYIPTHLYDLCASEYSNNNNITV